MKNGFNLFLDRQNSTFDGIWEVRMREVIASMF